MKKGTYKRLFIKKMRKTNTSKVVNPSELKSKLAKNAKEAILDYEVVKYNEEINLSVIKVLLHTGRHHQIRVQFSSRIIAYMEIKNMEIEVEENN